MKKILKNSGFTLIELMVVIVIIGILAALAIPKFTGASAKAKITEAPRILASFETSELAYIEETGSAAASTSLAWTSPTSKWWGYKDVAGTPGAFIATPSMAFTAGEWTTSVTLTTTVTAGSVAHTSGGDAVVKKYLPNFLP